MTACCLTDLFKNHSKIDDTRNDEMTEDGDFPALRFSFDRQMHIHHSSYFDTKNKSSIRVIWLLQAILQTAD